MRLKITLTLFALLGVALLKLQAQPHTDSCQTITVKRPHVSARFNGNLNNYLEKNIDSTLFPQQNCSAIFQLQTDCDGNVVKVIILKSFLPAALQQKIYDLLLHSPKWIPARNNGFYVWTVISLSIQATPTTITVRSN